MNRKIVILSIALSICFGTIARFKLTAVDKAERKNTKDSKNLKKSSSNVVLPFMQSIPAGKLADSEITLSKSGYYIFSGDATTGADGADTAGITITASDITLDLGGKTFSSSKTNGESVALINVTVTTPQNICIRNGKIKNANAEAIRIVADATNITLENLDIISTTSSAINFVGASTDVSLRDISIDTIDRGDGIEFNGACVETYLENISINNVTHTGTSFGIYFDSTVDNIVLKDINIYNVGADHEGYGVYFNDIASNVDLESIKVNTVTMDGIHLGQASSSSLSFKGLSFSSTSSSSINFGSWPCKNVLFDGVNSVSSTKGLHIYAGSENVTLKNSFISGATTDGIVFAGTEGSPILNCTIDNVTVVNSTNAEATDAKGLSMAKCCYFNVINSNFDKNATYEASGGYSAYGVYLDTCTGCKFINCEANGNEGALKGAGFYVSSGSYGNRFQDCVAMMNTGSGYDATGLVVEGTGVGFETAGSSTIFDHCSALESMGTVTGVGFYLNAASNNELSYCKANRNTTILTGDDKSAGSGSGTAVGIALSGSSTNNKIINSEANGNIAGSTATNYAAGIVLSASAFRNRIENSEASANDGTDGFGYGILIQDPTADPSGIVLKGNETFGNTGLTNSYYGICEWGTDSSTLYTKNISYGHGEDYNFYINYSLGDFASSSGAGSVKDLKSLATTASEWDNINITA